MSEFCLTLLCPSSIEEKLLDLLLMSPNVTVFTSAPTAAHGLTSDGFNQTEQVLGRAFVTQVQMIFSEADKVTLLGNIHQQFSGAGLRYWITSVTESGEIP